MLTEEALDRWLHRIPDAYRAYRNDPLYNSRITMWRHLLATVEMAMEDNGVDMATRERVINTAIYGSPDVGQALERLATADAEDAAAGPRILMDDLLRTASSGH
ncbi:hypothetical protein [Saccharothrix hoggarensis]|uniref:Uncharacterized protein n=1 Tax=Saccharothrix hoggarensis TaxID=913853 RepID=A0ABW3QIP1_9PSEU